MRGQVFSRPVGLGRDLMIALALFAAVVRALVPQGFMVSMESGEPSIIICTADGMRTLTGEPTDAHKKSDLLAGMNTPCAFAGLAMMAPPPDVHIVSVDQAISLVLLSTDETPTAFFTRAVPAAGATRAALSPRLID